MEHETRIVSSRMAILSHQRSTSMFDQQMHEMQIECTYPTGAEEWLCPACGRRFLMQWPPKYKRIILDPGDELARHAGGKGGVRIGAAEVMPAEEALPLGEPIPGGADMPDIDPADPTGTPITDELRPWLKWLRDSGLGDE
jgi:hypothetical protein